MNSIEGDAVSTIHITPEDGFSYASFEAAGYDLKQVNMGQLIERVLACFEPKEFSVSVHCQFGAHLFDDIHVLDMKGYTPEERCVEELGLGGSIIYQKFVRTASCGSPRSILKCFM
ncbi:S-adenosylmethionine decarboxylase proenzyme [Sesamum angolense]|uniref:S-adenosylmethionine decarboxylase proenzyme n=3 Tax=Sesamum TaxID=4181 RepID=A0AAE1XFA9_9LAMI|nr:S-adenosylmethionine decarboxylase proenzyme [Sesamum angolense]